MREELLRNGFPPRQLRVLPYYSVTPNTFHDQAWKHTGVILFVGRVLQCKGVGHLIKAFTRLKAGCTLIIAGDGPYVEKAQRVSRALRVSDRVKFVGWLHNTALSEYYNAAEFVVVPSIWPEPFGIVGIEAMAHAKAVIAYDVGGIPDWLKHGVNGYLVERGNISALAAAMQELLSDSAKAKELGRNGRALFEESHTSDVHLPALLGILSEAIEEYRLRSSAEVTAAVSAA
jgi:glycosyltransferase involved in cell wall biosynthesis